MQHQIHPWIDSSFAPVYVTELPTAPTDAEFKAYLDAWESFTRNQTTPYAVLMDGRALMKLQPTQRKMAADMDKRLAPWDRALGAGCCFIMTQAISRGLLTAFLWLSPPVYPYKVVASREEGIAWLRQRLATFVPGKVEVSP